jgi:PKHD-type hydroxylase
MNNINELNNSTWPFYLDKKCDYAYLEKCFTKEECEKITQIGKNKKLQKAKIFEDNNGKKNIKKNYRDTNICWLSPQDDLQWVYQRITDTVLHLNERFFNFDLHGIAENLQFTNYKSPSGKYKKHIDSNLDYLIRKLSVSIQLSDIDDYEGGDLIIYTNEKGTVMKKNQGDLIVFPSFILHAVTEVTKGERNSLVAWVTGKQFK